MPESKLNILKQKFIENLIDGMSQVKAYMEAYEVEYNTAKVNASRLLTNANIQEGFEKKRNERERIRRLKMSHFYARLSDAAVNAVDEMAKLIEYSTPKDRVKLAAIKAVLDRAGF